MGHSIILRLIDEVLENDSSEGDLCLGTYSTTGLLLFYGNAVLEAKISVNSQARNMYQNRTHFTVYGRRELAAICVIMCDLV